MDEKSLGWKNGCPIVSGSVIFGYGFDSFEKTDDHISYRAYNRTRGELKTICRQMTFKFNLQPTTRLPTKNPRHICVVFEENENGKYRLYRL